MSWNLCPGQGLLYPSRDRGSPGPAINSVTHGRRRLHTFPLTFHSSRRKGIEEQPLPSCVHAYCAKWLRMSLGPELAVYQVQKNQSLQWSFLCSTIHIQSSSKWFYEKKKTEAHPSRLSALIQYSLGKSVLSWQVAGSYAAVCLAESQFQAPLPLVGEGALWQTCLWDLCA